MKRRRFFSALAALPAAPALLAQTQQTTTPNPAPQPPPAEARGGRGGGRMDGGASNIPSFEETASDLVGDAEPRFFTPAQFAALKNLGGVLMPPMKGRPGAVECGAPEFLDFLVGASPAERQDLYRHGLDGLNRSAQKKLSKNFADLNASEAEAVIRPLLVQVDWTYDPPKDPMQHFMAEAQHDIREATQNSRQWAEAGARSGRRGFGGQGQFVKPIDPIYRS